MRFAITLVLGLMPLMAVADSHALVVVAVLINGLGIGLMMPTLITWIMSLVGFQQRGRAAGFFTAAFFAGEFVSPLVVAVLKVSPSMVTFWPTPSSTGATRVTTPPATGMLLVAVASLPQPAMA